LTCTLFSDSVSKAMNSNMAGRIHKPLEGRSFKEGSWNDYQLYAQQTIIGGTRRVTEVERGDRHITGHSK
jgi:hypothetical protein